MNLSNPLSELMALLPQICLVALAILLLFLDLALPINHRRSLGWVTAAGLLLIGGLSALFAHPTASPALVLGGMYRQDWLSFTFLLIFLLGALVTALLAMGSDSLGNRGEFYILLVVATLGMSLMAGSADLILLYLAVETTSIPLYVMAGFLYKDNRSAEAGIKYLLFGAMASAVMLYGFSLLFGFGGTTQLYSLASQLAKSSLPPLALAGVLFLVFVGFAFKISAVPFHFWAPDVYEGAPTPVAAFLSTASKAAGFAVLLRFLPTVFPGISSSWSIGLGVISVASMTLGNALALTQTNIKRLLAYSSIAQAGYILIGAAAACSLGYASVVFYLVSYLFTNLTAFGVVTVVGKTLHSDDLSAYHGLSRRAPGLSLILLVALLSLAGVPPFSGFTSKVLVLAAAVDARLIWLAVLGIVNSILGLYYYLNILKRVYLYRSDQESEPIAISLPWRIALTIGVIGILGFGIFLAPLMTWANQVTGALF